MRLTRKIICITNHAPLCMDRTVNFLGPLVGERWMLIPRLIRWLPFAILFVVFISTLAPAQETPPQEPQAVLQPAGETPNPLPEDPAAANDPIPPLPDQAAESPLPASHDLSPWGMFMAADIVVKSVM